MRALVFLLAIIFSGPGWPDECDKLPKPSITVKRLDERITVNTQHSYKVLNHLGSALARPGKQILGLTRGNASVRFASNISLYVDRTGRWECASPQLTVTLGFSPMTVYVAKEFPEGSCAYKEIYQHELRHVKAYQAHLAGIEKEVTDTLQRRFDGGSIWRGPVGQSSAQLRRELDERWLPYIRREIGRADEAQALIDSPEEYARVADSCNGEIRKLIR
ncbi:hypothetical protein [Propionivibrio sp.]|uniref:hypothetical protein n=1 Tax=Propionivibrio sp. TaxID=2212460 RepID=UPI003BF257EC